jgi:hypothetical protein
VTDPRFPRDRYKPEEFVTAFDATKPLAARGDVYSTLNIHGVEIEIYFPECDGLPVPDNLLQLARQACQDVRTLDNLVQCSCESESSKSESDPRSFELHLAYLMVFRDRLHARYWGIKVNTEWEAEFAWNNIDTCWQPTNF